MKKLSLKNNKKVVKSLLNVIYPLVTLGIVLAVWAIVAHCYNKPIVMPSPAVVLERFFLLFGEKSFWTDIAFSLLRVVECFALSFAFALVLGSLAGIFKPVAKVLAPIVSILRSAPTMAVILLALVWIGAKNAPLLIGFLVAFPVMYQGVQSSISGVDSDLVQMCDVYKVSFINRVRFLYIPQIAPTLFDCSQSTLSLTLKVVIAAEVLAYTKHSIRDCT